MAGLKKTRKSTIESILLRESIAATEYEEMKEDMVQAKCEAY